MKNKLLIIGASGHGKVISDIAVKMNKWESIAFLDDDKSKKSLVDLKVIGTLDDIQKYIDQYDIFVGIGNNNVRRRLLVMLESMGASIPVLIHPKSVIGTQVKLGVGTVVMAGAIINVSTQIGKGCIINTGTTVDHDNIIEDFVHLSPGTHLAGAVKVGQGSWLGIGSVVSNNISITNGSRIGAGAVVVKDIKTPGTYVGIPAKKIY